MMPANADSTSGSAAALRLFLRDFAAYAGRGGILTAFLIAFGALLEGLGLVLLVPLLGIVIGSGTPSSRLDTVAVGLFKLLGVERPTAKLAVLLAMFCALMLVRAIVISMRDSRVSRLQIGFMQHHRLHLAESLAAARWDQVMRLRYARITHFMTTDVPQIGVATYFVLQTVVSAAILLAQCLLVFLLAPMLALAAGVLLGAVAALFARRIWQAERLGGAVSNTSLSLLNSTAQFLGGLKLAISQNLQKSFLAEFQQTLQALSSRQLDYRRQQSNSHLALSTIAAVGCSVLILVGFAMFEVEPASLLALVLIISRMFGPVGQLQGAIQQIAFALPAYGKVLELEAELATASRAPSGEVATVALPRGPIVFDGVSFHHQTPDDTDGTVPGVSDISLAITPGQFVGVSGPSGAGKTTFADLLVGLYPPQQGRVSVAGAPLEGAALAFWREHVSYVTQEPFLFHDTIRRNLLWANAQASEDAMWTALAFSGAERLVRGQPLGLDTIVGERGALLSGGERQRIAVARAMLRAPHLVVLDEATSAIDVAGELDILQRLHALQPRPTVVIIAHRAESLALCERVLRFESGRCNEVAVSR